MSQQITVLYTSIDRCRSRRKFKTIEGARKFAQQAIGEHPEIGHGYAVSGDGIGKIQVAGVTLADIFPGTVGESDAEREQREWAENRAARRMAEGHDDYQGEGEDRYGLPDTAAGRRGYDAENMTPEQKLDVLRALPYVGADGRLKVSQWYAANGVCEVDFETNAICF